MTALLKYLNLLRDAWEAKLLHAKQIKQSFLCVLLSYVFILKSTRLCKSGTRVIWVLAHYCALVTCQV